MIAELQGSARCTPDQNPFVHRPLMLIVISLQVCSPARQPSLSDLLSPSPQRLHLHSFIPHPCSIPGPPSTARPLSPSSHYHHSLPLVLLSHSPKGRSLHFALSHLFPQIRSFPSVSQFLYASSSNPCLHTQSLYVCVFTVSNLSSLTTFLLLGPTLSSFLLLMQWHCYDSFTHASKPYSFWLLLPNTRSTLPTISPCSHLTPLFSVPFPILLMPLVCPMTLLSSFHY